jgi:hypothetical protein
MPLPADVRTRLVMLADKWAARATSIMYSEDEKLALWVCTKELRAMLGEVEASPRATEGRDDG